MATLGDKTYSGWSLISADKNGNINTTAWKNIQADIIFILMIQIGMLLGILFKSWL